MSKSSENGNRKKINGILYLVMQEIKMTNGTENGRRQRNKQKWKGLEEMEKMDVKKLVEAEDRSKKIEGHKCYWRKGAKRQTNTKWERNE